MELKADPKRMGLKETGIYVRAWVPDGGPKSVDLAELDRDSLVTWIRGSQEKIGLEVNFAERLLLSLLGHEMSDDGNQQRSD